MLNEELIKLQQYQVCLNYLMTNNLNSEPTIGWHCALHYGKGRCKDTIHIYGANTPEEAVERVVKKMELLSNKLNTK